MKITQKLLSLLLSVMCILSLSTITTVTVMAETKSDIDYSDEEPGDDELGETRILWYANKNSKRGIAANVYRNSKKYFFAHEYRNSHGLIVGDDTTDVSYKDFIEKYGDIAEGDEIVYTYTMVKEEPYSFGTTAVFDEFCIGYTRNGTALTASDYEISPNGSKLVIRVKGPLKQDTSALYGSTQALEFKMLLPDATFEGDINPTLTVGVYDATGAKNSVTISPEDTIGVKFNLVVSKAAGGTIEVLYNKNTTNYSTARGDKNGNPDVFPISSLTPNKNGTVSVWVDLLPAQICDPIDIVVKDSSGSEVFRRNNFTIKEYCDYQVTNSKDTQLTDLCKAIVKYGAASQTYFNYNTENLATKDGDYGSCLDVPAEYATGNIVKGTNVQSLSATMVEGSGAVEFRFNFKLKQGEQLANGSLSNVGVGTASFGTTTGREFVSVVGIKPTQFKKTVNLTVTGTATTTIVYSVNHFAYAKANNSDAATSDFGKSLYTYGQAAIGYFGE